MTSALMVRKRPKRKSSRGRRNGASLVVFNEFGASAFGRAFHSHVEELAYERLKDPEYQEWMRAWLDGFLSAFLRGLRAEKAGVRKRRGDRTSR
jgi:hypothetical protein